MNKYELSINLAGSKGIVWIALLLLAWTLKPVGANTLAKPVKDNGNSSIAIELNPPGDLNFKTKAEVLGRRDKLVEKYASLLQDKYKPSASVFQNIEDSKPWWGMIGAFVWGPGPHSIDGPAEESRFVLNPYLLVGANPGTALIWQTDRLKEGDFANTNFPLCWLPKALTFFPGSSVAQVTYAVSQFEEQLKARADKLNFRYSRLKLNQFALVAYNARDFGFQYLYVDIAKSINLVNVNGCSQPVFIKQMLHCGPSSKYPGGCNNMSPPMREIDDFAITSLPARACVYLWKNKPSSVTQKADFTFYLDFR